MEGLGIEKPCTYRESVHRDLGSKSFMLLLFCFLCLMHETNLQARGNPAGTGRNLLNFSKRRHGGLSKLWSLFGSPQLGPVL